MYEELTCSLLGRNGSVNLEILNKFKDTSPPIALEFKSRELVHASLELCGQNGEWD